MNRKALKAEIIKCGTDPEYFIRKYVKIQHPVRGLIPFDLYDYQSELLTDYQENRFNVILKARQLGISETTAAYATWMMMFRRDKNIIVIATKKETAKNIIRKVATAIKNLPAWLMLAKVTTDNVYSIELSNGSRIKAVSTAKDAGRSEAGSLLIIDEAAHIENMADIWTGLRPVVTAGGAVIMLSTPLGVGNTFHKTYVQAIKKENDFKPTKLMWWVHPERKFCLIDDDIRPGFKTSEWFKKEIAGMEPREIAQELECVTAGARVVTRDGFKLIENIEIGDLVLTHKGRFKRVTATRSKVAETSELMKLTMPMSRKNPVYVTKNHPLAVRVKNRKSTHGVLKNLGHTDFEWKNLNELDVIQDTLSKKYVNMIYPTLDSSSFSKELNWIDLAKFECCSEATSRHVRYKRQRGKTVRHIQVDYRLGRVVGLFLAEGCKNERAIQFAFHDDETELIGFMSRFCDDLGISYSIDNRDYSRCTTVNVSSFFLSSIIDMFVSGTNCYTKLLKSSIWKADQGFIRGIIDGIWQDDGLHNPTTKNVLRLANEKLIYQIRMLMTSFSLLTRVSYDGPKSWYLELNNTDGKKIEECTAGVDILEKRQSRCKFFEGAWWANVRTEKYDKQSGEVTVYNFSVEDDESYIIENLVVHNCNFNASGDNFISSIYMDWVRDNTILNPISFQNWDRQLHVWEEPSNLTQYFITADVARGDGKDNSAFHVFDSETMVQVAEYYAKIPPDDFAGTLCQVGVRYNNALLVIENNSIGLACLNQVKSLEYENVYYSRKGDFKAGESFNMMMPLPSINEFVPGFTTSGRTRPLMLQKLEEFIRLRTVTIRSNRVMEELRKFVWNKGKAQAMTGYNDDLVISLALACWMKETFITPNMMTSGMSKTMLDLTGLDSLNHTSIPGATKDPGHVKLNESRARVQANNPYKLALPGGGFEDIGWLISSK